MKKQGADKILSIYWFVILFIVAGGIVYMAFLFYGTPYNVRPIESGILGDQIANCLTSKGYLNESIFSEGFKKNFAEDCHLNFNVEDVYNWKNQPQYYVEVEVYKFNQSFFGLIGDKLLNISVGNVNLKTAWQLTSTTKNSQNIFNMQRGVNTIVIHSTEGATAKGAVETIGLRHLSVHYMINRNGEVISKNNAPSQYRNAFKFEKYIADHVGCGIGKFRRKSCTPNCVDSNGLLDLSCQALDNPPQDEFCCIQNFNQKSIGIELVNLGSLCSDDSYKDTYYCKNSMSVNGKQWESFSDAQITSLVSLVSDIASRYNIPLDRNHIIGHYQVTTYKTDPGPAFPWSRFMRKLQLKGAVRISDSSSNHQQKGRSFYAVDKEGNQYIVKILALIGKEEKNV